MIIFLAETNIIFWQKNYNKMMANIDFLYLKQDIGIFIKLLIEFF